VQSNKEGQPTSFWKTKPALMLAKCAEMLALRKCFPQELSGLYSSEEINVDTSTGEIVESTARPVANPLAADVAFAPARDERLFKRMQATGKEIMGDAWRNGEGRELLKHVTGKESTKDLSNEEMEAVIAQLDTMRSEEEPELVVA